MYADDITIYFNTEDCDNLVKHITTELDKWLPREQSL